MARFLLVGLPRSGTTWVATSLTHGPNIRYLDEPDGFREPFPFRVMMRYGENPILAVDDPAREYDRLWRGIYGGGFRSHSVRGRIAQTAFDRAGTPARQRARAGEGTSALLQVAMRTAVPPQSGGAPESIFVKSVQCIGAVEWIVRRYSPRVIVLFRSVLNTVASWNQLDFVRNPREVAALALHARARWGVEPLPADAPAIAQQTFMIATQTAMLRAALAAHPEWTVASHEDLCVDAPTRMGELAASVGIEWTDAARDAVRASDRDGSDPFGTRRPTSLQPDRWRERLTESDLAQIRTVLARFPAQAQLRGEVERD